MVGFGKSIGRLSAQSGSLRDEISERKADIHGRTLWAKRPVRTATRSHNGSHFLPPFFHSYLNVILLPPSCTVTVARVCASARLQTRLLTPAR